MLAAPTTVLCGLSSKHRSGPWRRWDTTVGRLIEGKLSHHTTAFKKDGDGIAFVDAELLVPVEKSESGLALYSRQRDSITSIQFAGFDIDDGGDLEQIKARIVELGYFAILYTTFTHGKTLTTIPLNGGTEPPTPDELCEIADRKGLKGARLENLKVDRKGNTTLVIRHKPLVKFRILFPLSTPFALDHSSRKAFQTSCGEWSGRLSAFARNILKIEIDETGGDVNRLFFTPRHAAAAKDKWDLTICAGRALSVEDMPFNGAVQRKSSHNSKDGKSSTSAPPNERPFLSDGFDLLAWNREFGHRFLVVDFLEEIAWEVRDGGNGDDRAHIECPNDAQHTDAGNPNDKGCLAQNSDGDSGFWITCRHNHCRDVWKLDMLKLIEADVALPDGVEQLSELLCKPEFYWDPSDDEADAPLREDYLAAVDDTADADDASTDLDIMVNCRAMLSKVHGATLFDLKRGQIRAMPTNTENPKWSAICDPFYVKARTHTETGDGHGLIIGFKADEAGYPVKELRISRGDLVEDPRKVAKKHIDKGFRLIASANAKNKLAELLSIVKAEADVITATRPGWHRDVFFSPTGEVFGAEGADYRIDDHMRLTPPTSTGTLQGWRKAVDSALACSNLDFQSVGLFGGFAGCIVDLIQEPASPIINFVGTTSHGKTTAQRLGGSVWSNPYRDGLVVKFKTTDNAI